MSLLLLFKSPGSRTGGGGILPRKYLCERRGSYDGKPVYVPIQPTCGENERAEEIQPAIRVGVVDGKAVYARTDSRCDFGGGFLAMPYVALRVGTYDEKPLYAACCKPCDRCNADDYDLQTTLRFTITEATVSLDCNGLDPFTRFCMTKAAWESLAGGTGYLTATNAGSPMNVWAWQSSLGNRESCQGVSGGPEWFLQLAFCGYQYCPTQFRDPPQPWFTARFVDAVDSCQVCGIVLSEAFDPLELTLYFSAIWGGRLYEATVVVTE